MILQNVNLLDKNRNNYLLNKKDMIRLHCKIRRNKMNKVVAKLFAGALIASLPLAVNAKTLVNNEEELQKAINNTEEKEIVLSFSFFRSFLLKS